MFKCVYMCVCVCCACHYRLFQVKYSTAIAEDGLIWMPKLMYFVWRSLLTSSQFSTQLHAPLYCTASNFTVMAIWEGGHRKYEQVIRDQGGLNGASSAGDMSRCTNVAYKCLNMAWLWCCVSFSLRGACSYSVVFQ